MALGNAFKKKYQVVVLMLILLVLLNMPPEEQGIYLEISSVFTVILFVWQAPKASATQKGSISSNVPAH